MNLQRNYRLGLAMAVGGNYRVGTGVVELGAWNF